MNIRDIQRVYPLYIHWKYCDMWENTYFREHYRLNIDRSYDERKTFFKFHTSIRKRCQQRDNERYLLTTMIILEKIQSNVTILINILRIKKGSNNFRNIAELNTNNFRFRLN